MRLNIPAGTAVRFEPGDTKKVTLVELGGTPTVYGINGLKWSGGSIGRAEWPQKGGL